MQTELETTHPELDIQIIGINEIGHESANALMTSGHSLPWLQDVDANNNQLSDVWTEQWDVVYRDVIIVDKEMTELGAFNLTTYNLADPATYAALRSILVDVAADQPFWQNGDNPLDVNKDGIVSAQGDVLPCINELNNRFLSDNVGQLPALRLPPIADARHFDVNGDGLMTAQADVLPIVNFLNNPNQSEGEYSASTWNALPAEVTYSTAGAPQLELAVDPGWTVEVPPTSGHNSVILAELPETAPRVGRPSLGAATVLATALDPSVDDTNRSDMPNSPSEPDAAELYDDLYQLDELADQIAADVASAWS